MTVEPRYEGLFVKLDEVFKHDFIFYVGRQTAEEAWPARFWWPSNFPTQTRQQRTNDLPHSEYESP